MTHKKKLISRTGMPWGWGILKGFLEILVVAVLLSEGASAQEAGVIDTFDPLTTPATQTFRASTSVLLAVTQAGNRVVAAGERGIIIYSDDGGNSWKQAKVPVSVAITNMDFPTGKSGWAVGHGGAVLNSEDGGETWRLQMSGKEAAEIELQAARNGNSKDRRLADAQRLVSDGPDKPLLDVKFWTPQDGMVVGAYGLAFVTHDGGKTWNSIMGGINNPKGKHLYKILIDQQTVFIAGEQGALYRGNLTDLKFDELKTPYAGTFFGLVQTPKNALIVFGLRGNAYRSEDQGKSWQKIDIGSSITLTSGLVNQRNEICLADAAGRLLFSRDEGKSFELDIPPNPIAINGFVSVGDKRIVMAGAAGIRIFEPGKNKKGDGK